MNTQLKNTASNTPFDASQVEASRIELDRLIMEMLIKRARECDKNYNKASWLTRWYWRREHKKAWKAIDEFMFDDIKFMFDGIKFKGE